MKIDQLKLQAVRDPFSRGSTSRFRLAGGTLWFKDDEGYFSPLLSHGKIFVGDWGTLPHYSEIEISSRAYNQMTDLYSTLKRNWLRGLCTGGVECSESGEELVYPAVSIKFPFKRRKMMRVQRPSLAASKMLLRGRHPENGTSRLQWADGNFDEAEKDNDPYKSSFQQPFEEVTEALAFGAVSKENLLRDLTQTLSQLKTSLDTSANDMVGELKNCADRIFAPDSEESSGEAKPHLHKLIKKMSHFKSMSAQCRRAADIFANVSAAPDSRMARVKTPDDDVWELSYPSSIASIHDLNTNGHWSDHPYSCADIGWNSCAMQLRSANDEGSVTLRFADHNVRSLSFYWMRRYKEFYEEVLGKIDCSLPDLFGKKPQDWDYLELAAPIFAAS